MPNLMADMMCKEALGLAAKYLPIAVHEPHNRETDEKMNWAAMMSGHAIANQISDTYNLPHGVGEGGGMAALARYNVHGDPAATRITDRDAAHLDL
jgi:alcohol dehydrogenase class IV